MGQKGAHTCDVIFANVSAGQPHGRWHRQRWQGFRTAMKVLDKGPIVIAAVYVDVAERTLAETLRYAMERKQVGQPIAEFQLVQVTLADCKTELYAARNTDLDAHIADVLNVIGWEGLSDVVLCGHFYGGIVVTGVADVIAEKFSAVVFLDAFLPEDGDSTMGFLAEERQARILKDAE